MKRIVITGMGAINPNGTGVAHSWKKLFDGQSGISTFSDSLLSSCQLTFNYGKTIV